jgi:phosphonate transport system substrate-binding protein
MALAAGLTLAGCAATSHAPEIRLDRLEPLPTPAANGELPLRVAVGAVISPQGTVQSYQALLNYLAARLERPVELVQRRTYAEVNDLVQSGAVDMALVCTSAYVVGHDQFGMELLAAPIVNGEMVYHSVLIVPADSPARTMADLAGQTFAFTDPMSNSGRAYPTHLVQELGSNPEAFFGRTFFTYSHDDAIRAVAKGLADGAAVDSLVLDYALQREPELAARVREIHRSPPFGIPPAVVGPGLRPQLKATLRSLLVTMAEDPEGRAALAAAGIDRFVEADDAAYQTARDLVRMVGDLQP